MFSLNKFNLRNKRWQVNEMSDDEIDEEVGSYQVQMDYNEQRNKNLQNKEEVDDKIDNKEEQPILAKANIVR